LQSTHVNQSSVQQSVRSGRRIVTPCCVQPASPRILPIEARANSNTEQIELLCHLVATLA
jgi:hypothetical protein